MRLVTFLYQGNEHIGVQLATGILDLNRLPLTVPKSMKAFLAQGEMAFNQVRQALASIHEAWTIPESDITLLAPVPRPEKIICIGHNYAGHIGKGKKDLPDYPNLFCKTVNTTIGHNQPVVIPAASEEVDYEAELMAVIGKRVRNVSEIQAQTCIAGYTIFNDVSARDYQKRTSQWMLAKSFDTFGPMGPALLTPDEIPDPYNLELELTVNGIPQQHANTRDIIFPVPYLISYISQVMTLEIGDVIATGTPAKLREATEQHRFLQPGDLIRITIDTLGTLVNPVVAGIQTP